MQHTSVIITSNSPGELSTWVAPVVRRLHAAHPDWRFCLALVPCPFASGYEEEFARRIEGINVILSPWQTLKVILGGALPFPRAQRGIVLYLGGDPWHALALSRRWQYRCLAYVTRRNPLWRFYAGLAVLNEDLAAHLSGGKARVRQVGYVGWPAPSAPLVVGESASSVVSESASSVVSDGARLCLGLFPGSRLIHLRFTLGPFMAIARSVAAALPQTDLALAVSPFVSREALENVLEAPMGCGHASCGGRLEGDTLCIQDGPRVKVVWGDSRRVIESMDLALCIPGTNTGEIAAAGKPLVVGLTDSIPVPSGGLGCLIERLPGVEAYKRYRRHRFYERKHFAAQPNRKAGKMICPEIIAEPHLSNVVQALLDLLNSAEERARQSRELRAAMGDPGLATERLCAFIEESLSDGGE